MKARKAAPAIKAAEEAKAVAPADLPSLADDLVLRYASGELERVYFRFPDYCNLLSEESKQSLLWGVDRDTPGKQIQEFLKEAEPLRMEMLRERDLHDLKAWRLMMEYKSAAVNSMFILAFPLNLLITELHSAEGPGPHDTEARLLMLALGRILHREGARGGRYPGDACGNSLAGR